MTIKVLFIDDDHAVRDALGQSLTLDGLEPVLAGSFVAAKDHISRAFAGVVVTDVRMPGRDGFHVLAHAQAVDADLPVILLTGEADVPLAVQAMTQGAFGFLAKPCAPAEFIAQVRTALDARAQVLDARAQKQALESGDAAARMLFGHSAQAQALRETVRRVAQTEACVLVTGEAGSGTPKVAEVIHLLSSGARKPFVKRTGGLLDVQALGAALDAAAGGTLFIDEVGTLPSAAQFALLDRLESGPAARVIAGATATLDGAVATGHFSGDLLEKLTLLAVHVPPLRDRPDDIPVLFRHYVKQACEQAALPVPEISQTLLADIMAQPWPGNARALMSHAMRYALGVLPDVAPEDLGLVEQINRFERSVLVSALERAGGRAGIAAAALKLPRKTFYDKLAKHDLKPETYRQTPA